MHIFPWYSVLLLGLLKLLIRRLLQHSLISLRDICFGSIRKINTDCEYFRNNGTPSCMHTASTRNASKKIQVSLFFRYRFANGIARVYVGMLLWFYSSDVSTGKNKFLITHNYVSNFKSSLTFTPLKLKENPRMFEHVCAVGLDVRTASLNH